MIPYGKTVRVILMLITIAIGIILPAKGEIYKWQDEEGTWHFSDSPTMDSRAAQIPAVAIPQDSPKTANAPQRTPRSAGQSHAGLFWRIHAQGHSPSFVLGTIHSEDPRITRIRPTVASVLDHSARFIMEMRLDPLVFFQMGAAMLLEEGRHLESIVGTKTYIQAVAAMATIGVPEPVVGRLKPWAVMAMLSMPKSKGGAIMDMVLWQRAQGQGKPTSGLETVEEQLSVFNDLSTQDQIDLLRMTLDQLPSQAMIFEQLIEAYVADDLAAIQALADKSGFSAETPAAAHFRSRLNDERNQRMVQRIIPYLEQGNSFIAVGALHLGGPQGILALLRKHGYRTEPVR